MGQRFEEHHQRRDRGGEPGYPGKIDPARDLASTRHASRWIPGDPADAHGQDHQGEGDIDEEDGTPPPHAGQHAAERETKGGGDLQSAEHSVRRCGKPGLLRAPPDQQHGWRVTRRTADPDERPVDDQGSQILAKPASDPADEHDQGAGQEDPPGTELLGQFVPPVGWATALAR